MDAGGAPEAADPGSKREARTSLDERQDAFVERSRDPEEGRRGSDARAMSATSVARGGGRNLLHEALGHHRDLSHLCAGGAAVSAESSDGKCWATAEASVPEACRHFQRSARAERETQTRESRASARSHGCVYKITHRASGKAYVGLTLQVFSKRMTTHAADARKGNGKSSEDGLYAAVRKFGWDAFDKEVLYADVPKCFLGRMEIIAIGLYNTMVPNGYNLIEGGKMSPFCNPRVQVKRQLAEQSDATKTKRRATYDSAEFRQKVASGSRDRWNELTPAQHQARAQHQANGRHAEFTRRRELRIASMSYTDGKRYWERQRYTCIHRARARLRKYPERFVGVDPVRAVEEWFGPSFEERRRA